jgi:hypothetical protein
MTALYYAKERSKKSVVAFLEKDSGGGDHNIGATHSGQRHDEDEDRGRP